MKKSNTDSFQSVPDKQLTAAVELLDQWDSGTTLDEAVIRAAGGPMLLNTMFTLLRRLGTIDFLIGRFARDAVKPRLRNVLRWGVCQIVYLNGVPPAAAVDTCVRYTKQRIHQRQSGFVNAVLRRVSALAESDQVSRELESAPDWVRLNLGRDLYKQWSLHFSASAIAELAALLQLPASLTVRQRGPASESSAEVPGLRPLEMPAWAGSLCFQRCVNPDVFFSSVPWARGGYYVQDLSTAMAPVLLAPRAGETVADLCAAPGGKTLILAETAGAGATVIAADRSRRRLRRLRENLRVSDAVHVLAADVVRAPFRINSLDAVLLDVPCSNTGVIRRRPDVRWRFSAQLLRDLVDLQASILAGAAALIKPGGRLVYSSCSIESEENSGQLRAFIARHPEFELADEHQLMPSPDHDGAYAALLRRRGSE